MSEKEATVNEQLAVGAASPGLHRVLGVWAATAFVVTNMVGTGIFTVPAFVRSATGNGLAALAVWAVGGGLSLCGALCYAELATRMPEAGGEYYYVTRTYGRLWGFLSGWISFFVGFSAPLAIASLGAAAYSFTLLGLDPGAPLIGQLGISQGAASAAILVLVLALFHSLGVRPSGRLQTAIAALVIGAIVVFVIAGLSTGRGDWRGVTEGSEATNNWWLALIPVSFAYSGWNAAAYLAGEAGEPHRTLPRALIGGTLAVTILYLALNLLFFYALPSTSWDLANESQKITIGEIAAKHLFGPGGAQIVSTIITLAIIGSVSAMTVVGPRVYYAMARDGLAPAIFSRLGRRSGAPIVAILVQAILSATLALTNAFQFLLNYVGSALLLFAGLTVAAVYLVRRHSVTGTTPFFRVPGYPVTPAIFLILVTVVWFNGLYREPLPTGAALATILFGAVIYYVGHARGWLSDGSAVADKQKETSKTGDEPQ
ncbi:MAG: amino acid permease [Acidobacteria bacterium]|nr:amino acid permease [Acidobacteriota bacterium]